MLLMLGGGRTAVCGDAGGGRGAGRGDLHGGGEQADLGLAGVPALLDCPARQL